ncbi:helix-turn-helix transcriptional regulator [Bradyrhizobium elkanii]|uniref:helix-turn-helix transcriptional regulator n=1 Tax=Bradyrhizobium elkanii TaxID=29448 RepID=UPI00209DD8CC|nr:LuxR family transcriptional regulator [Bradyrhizobium elkanii]MCP1968221.1 DNA-binding CsgD family transcriptional regulator [Bradyrhizobium elkanii]MCS4110278.1 DNA-binding CsgD family transcriptional regulator [Bradyrhizobium elkanii]
MHRVFQTFIDMLASAKNSADFSKTMAVTAEALELSCFAYLSLPRATQGSPQLISTYPTEWTAHYLANRYQIVDPVIQEALGNTEPFKWGLGSGKTSYSPLQQQLFDEASYFGIRLGFTVPIHDGRGPIAALTFASDRRNIPFENCIDHHSRVLQLMALYFHAHVRRTLESGHKSVVAMLSSRELECLEWASLGKSAWEIGQIIGISRHTVTSYLHSAKEKLGVRTIVQAVTLLATEKSKRQN